MVRIMNVINFYEYTAYCHKLIRLWVRDINLTYRNTFKGLLYSLRVLNNLLRFAINQIFLLLLPKERVFFSGFLALFFNSNLSGVHIWIIHPSATAT